MPTAKKQALDFTNVKEGGKFRKTRQVAGEYRATIMDVEDARKKDGGDPMWLWTIKCGPGIYPLYTAFDENQLWKIRNIFVAAGQTVAKKRLSVDPNKIVGKDIGVVLEDDDYDGKEQSSIAATIPLSDLTQDDESDEEGVDDEETVDEVSNPASEEDLDQLDVEEL